MDSLEKNDTNEDGKPEERVAISIILTKEGSVLVRGMLISDEIACYGLLKKAEQIISENHQASRLKVVKPNGNIMNFIRNGKH